MKILVFVKKTPDTTARIVPASGGAALDLSTVKYIINPYDEFAIEEAVKTKEALNEGEVVLACVSSPDVKELLIKGLAVGADRAILINNEGKDLSSTEVAKALTAIVKKEAPDLVFFGRHAIDDNNMHVAMMCSEILDWPSVNIATQFSLSADKKSCKVERATEGGNSEIYELTLPCFIGCDKALNQPRYAALPGIMKAKKKPMEEIKFSSLDVPLSPLFTSVSYSAPAEKPPGKIIDKGSLDANIAELVSLLRSEAKQI